MVDRPRILLAHIGPERVSFVQRDVDALSRRFEVRKVFYRSRKSIISLVTGTLWADITLSWFAWDQAAWAVRFSRMLGRKSIVVIAGFDVVAMPEISYGNLLSRHSATRTKYAITHATKVTAISESLKSDAERLSGRKDIEVVYLGFDPESFKPSGRKEPIVLTVGILNASNLQRKGLATFIKAAEFAPGVPFRLVGKADPKVLESLKGALPQNLKIVGEVDDHTLLDEMRRAAVYVQASAHEGFGCSLAEAMLCGCVPIVSKRGAIPEVVGDAGYYVDFGDANAIANLVPEAFKHPELGLAARERIVRLFPMENRAKRLIGIVEGLLK